MNKFLRLFLVAIYVVEEVSGQSAFSNFTTGVIDRLGETLTSVDCDDDTRANSQCNLAPFRGTYVCRPVASLFGREIKQTVCARNIIQGFTLGSVEDTCGCCPETGCPKVCGCPCGDNRVVVKASMFFGRYNPTRCVTNGWSQHLQAWIPGSAYECVDPDSEECRNFGQEDEDEQDEGDVDVEGESDVFAEPAEISP